jgi:hypothetical protein
LDHNFPPLLGAVASSHFQSDMRDMFSFSDKPGLENSSPTHNTYAEIDDGVVCLKQFE